MFESIVFQEEQDIKALQAKNRKLGEALDLRQVNESSLIFVYNSAGMYSLVWRKLNLLACGFAGD